MTVPAPVRFSLPPESAAVAPPERRGLRRDAVRLLLAAPGGIEHRRFHDLPELLAPGDLLVVNTPPTLPAAVRAGLPGGATAPVHVAGELGAGRWVVEVRRPDGRGPDLGLGAGQVLALPGGVRATLDRPHPDDSAAVSRLWQADVEGAPALPAYLRRHGRPITYGHLDGEYPLADYQTVYATDITSTGADADAGSAEMASAGRPFTERLLVRLLARGVVVAPVVLHAGVSSPELHEPPAPERFAVPEATARLVRATRGAGSRVVAVGTTAVRALESAATEDGGIRPRSGWTDLVLGPDRPAQVVDGLVTGLHEPEASHLLLLEAVAGRGLVATAYEAVTDPAGPRYLWHEFGDSMLLLPGRPDRP